MINNKHGYTLFECLIVISLITIATTLTVKISTSINSDSQLQKAAANLLNTLNYIAVTAALTGSDIEVVFNAMTNSWSPRANSLGAKSKIIGSTFFKEETLPNKLKFTQIQFGNTENKNVLLIRANYSASPGKIVISSNTGSRCEILQSLRGARRNVCYRG